MRICAIGCRDSPSRFRYHPKGKVDGEDPDS
jgi:hypothetical protein